MLYAIAVYRYNGGKLEQIQAAPKPQGGFFVYNPLQKLESITLPALLQQGMIKTEIYHFVAGDEHHYALQSQNNLIRALVSKKKLDDIEAYNLLRNSQYVALDKILANPLGYTGRDLSLDAVKTKVGELKNELLKVVDRTLLRGEELDVLVDKSRELRDISDGFDKEASKLNNYCCSYF